MKHGRALRGLLGCLAVAAVIGLSGCVVYDPYYDPYYNPGYGYRGDAYGYDGYYRQPYRGDGYYRHRPRYYDPYY